MIHNFFKIRHSVRGVEAIFEVQLQDARTVHMVVRRTNYLNDKRFVVVVDAAKLLSLWRNDPSTLHTKQSHGNPETWMRDKKYHDAVEGFSRGIENPVPLADITCNQYDMTVLTGKRRATYCAFINGVTRTIWLLSHGAKYFPIECSSGAELLVKSAGNEINHIISVENLIPLV